MSSQLMPITAEQLLLLPKDDRRYELVRGELRMMSPAGGRHGRVAHNLSLLLGNHVRQAQLGVVYAAETGFLIGRNPDTVRAPDVAFVTRNSSRNLDDDTGFVPFAPDMVGEIVSPSDAFSDVEEKVLGWLAAGTRLVLLADPATRTLHVYRAPDDILVLDELAILDASDVVPGWTLKVAELFR